jgi:hypothetical protein
MSVFLRPLILWWDWKVAKLARCVVAVVLLASGSDLFHLSEQRASGLGRVPETSIRGWERSEEVGRGEVRNPWAE